METYITDVNSCSRSLYVLTVAYHTTTDHHSSSPTGNLTITISQYYYHLTLDHNTASTHTTCIVDLITLHPLFLIAEEM